MSSSGRHPWDADDPYPGDDRDLCDHEDYESDILTGLATCQCGHRWHQTAQEISRERDARIAWDQHCEGEKNGTCLRCGNDSDALPGGHICRVEHVDTGDEIPF